MTSLKTTSAGNCRTTAIAKNVLVTWQSTVERHATSASNMLPLSLQKVAQTRCLRIFAKIKSQCALKTRRKQFVPKPAVFARLRKQKVFRNRHKSFKNVFLEIPGDAQGTDRTATTSRPTAGAPTSAKIAVRKFDFPVPQLTYKHYEERDENGYSPYRMWLQFPKIKILHRLLSI